MIAVQTVFASVIASISLSAFAGSNATLPADISQALYSEVSALAKSEENAIDCLSFGAITTFGTSCSLKAIYCSKNSKNAWAQAKDGSYKALNVSGPAVCSTLESLGVKLESDSSGGEFRIIRSVSVASKGSRPLDSQVTTTTYRATGTVEYTRDQIDEAVQPETIVAELRAEGYRYLMPRVPENFVSTRVLVLSSGAVKRISKKGSTETENDVIATLGAGIIKNIRSLALRLDSNTQVLSPFNQGPTACYGGEPTITLSLIDSASALHAAMQHATCKNITVDAAGIQTTSDVKTLNSVGVAIKQLYDFLNLAAADIAAVRD